MQSNTWNPTGNSWFILPKLNIWWIKTNNTQEKVERTWEELAENLQENTKENTQENSKLKDECLKQGINVIFNWNNNKEKILQIVENLEATHSLREFFEIFENQVKWWIYILASNKQISQAQEDINFVLSWKKAVYVEYNPVDDKPNLIKVSNISVQKMDELYDTILKKLLNIWESLNSIPEQQNIPSVIKVIENLYNIAKSINTYKLHKKNNKLDIPEEIKSVKEVLDSFERIGDFSFVINLINPLYAVWASNSKIDLELKIAEIARAFEETPFKIVITQVDISENEQIKPHSWWETIKQVTLDLPLFEKYKEVIKDIFTGLKNDIKQWFLNHIQKNPEYLDEIAKLAWWLYIPELEEHIMIYWKSHKEFNAKDFFDSFYKYKLEIIKKSQALEIRNDKIFFANVWGLEALKNDFLSTYDAIYNVWNRDLKRTYLLTWIPWAWKSYIAKSVANEFERISWQKWITLRFNISAIFDKYVWQTEKNFAQVVKVIDSLIESMDWRVVLWIDELEKAIWASSHETSEKLKWELLTTLEDKWWKNIFVISTVNDFSRLAPELVSRFANKYFFDIPWESNRRKIIELNLEKKWWNLSEKDLKEFVKETEWFVWREFDDLFSNISKTFSTILQNLVNKWKLIKEEAKNKKPSIKLIKHEVDKIKPTIQENTQKEKIAWYRQLKWKYLDPDEIVVKTNKEQEWFEDWIV